MIRSLFFLAAGCVLSACSAPSDSSKTQAAAVTPAAYFGVWHWIGSATDRIADPSRYSLDFQADGTVLVVADCNRGQGSYRLQASELTIERPALTKIGCGAQSRDREFLDAITQAKGLTPNGDQLQIELVSGDRMIFARAAR